MPKVYISGGLFACLLAIFIHVAQVLFLPAPLSKLVGQEAWLAVLIGGVWAVALGLFAFWVALRHPGLGPAQIARQVLGKWVGGVVGLIYAAFFGFVFSLVLRDILDFSQMILLPGTPDLVIIALFASVVLYSVWHGLEPIARVSFQCVVALVTATIILPLLETREYSIKQIEPFLYRGVGPLLQAVVIALPWFGESIAVMGLAPHLKHPKKAYRWLIIGLGGGVLILTGLVAHTMLVFGPDLPDRFAFPIYYMTQLISIAKILERIEVVLVIVWMSGMFIKASLYLYISAEAASQTLGLKHHRWTAVALALAALLGAYLWGSLLNVIHWSSTPGYIILFLSIETGIPLLLLAGSVFHRATRRRGSAHA